MKLKSIGVINWANLPSREYEFSEVTLITGESGAGKTTLLDAIQTILTAAAAGLYQYNPGQEEATQQSRTKETRTLASYFLGCDDGAYSRPDGAHGYIWANWTPESGETSEPFSAVIGCTAYLDVAGLRRAGKEEDLFFGLARGGHLSVDHFQMTDEWGQAHIVPLSDLPAHFKTNHPQCVLEPARGKEDYICRLYGAFRGMTSVNKIEARGAAKALSKFMVYKKLDNLDDFVRRDILEPHDLSEAIRQVSSMMRTINEMEQEAQGIENGVGLLHEAEKSMAAFVQTAVEEQLGGFERAYRGAVQLARRHSETEAVSAGFNRDIKNLISEQVDITAQLDQLAEQMRDLEMQRLGYGVLNQKARLERELKEMQKEQIAAAQRLLEANSRRSAGRAVVLGLHQSLDAAEAIFPLLEDRSDWDRQLSEVIEHDPWHALPLEKILSKGDLEELSQAGDHAARFERSHNALAANLKRIIGQLNQFYYQAKESRDLSAERKKELEMQISQLEVTNQVPYPYEVKKALKLISDQLPAADPQVLCDHVEVQDDSWQVAVEGLLANNRFLILVNPEYEARAMQVIEPFGLSKSAVLQGRKATLDTKGKSVAEDSIVTLLKFSHYLAENYFKAAYGNVRMVKDVETLSSTARGLMKNSMASAGYKMFVAAIAESELVFGRSARLRSVKARKEQLEKLDAQLNQAAERFRVASLWQEASANLAPLNLCEPLDLILRLQAAVSERQQQIKSLDLSECKEIESLIQEVKAQQANLSKKNDQINRQIGSNENEIRAMALKLESLVAAKEEKENQAQLHADILNRFAVQWPEISVPDKISAILEHDSEQESLHKTEGENSGAKLNHQALGAERSLEKFNEMRLRGSTINYSRFLEQNLVRGQSRENLVVCFSLACDLFRQIRTVLNFLRNDILAKHTEKLTEMTRRFNTAFISHLCHTLHNAVRDGKAKLDALNRKLRDHYFGEEFYRFDYKWVPEFFEYDKFFQEAVLLDSDGNASLFGQNALSKESRRIFTEICNKLLDPDVERSIEDLKRIADYRNYRTYDIKKCLPDRELSLKTYGSGSGGQMETPSYVIRSAGLSSALRFGEGGSHLKTVLIDESFSKMDEQRCKAVIDYLSEKLGLQILFVVPTMKAGALHDRVDQVIQVTKLPAQEPRGELKNVVLVTSNHLKKERVIELWQKERVAIETKAHQLSFLELLEV